MIRTKIPIIFSILISLSLPAEAVTKKSKTDQEARIKEIERTYASWDDISASFTQETHVKLIGKTITKTGTLKLKKTGKLRITYDGRGEKEYISDGSTLWIVTQGDPASLQVLSVEEGNVPKEALSFLGGFGKLRKEFKISASEEFRGNPAGTTPLHLAPRSKSAHYESLEALFGPDNLLTELIINNISGNRSHYIFKDIKTNQNPPDNMFLFQQ